MASKTRQKIVEDQHQRVPSHSKPRIPRVYFWITFGLAIVSWGLSGGFCRVTNHFAVGAIQQKNFEAADSWLRLTQRLQPNNAHALFLAARIARLQDDIPAMGRLLDVAERNGMDADRVVLERQLSQAQSGFLREVEPKITARLAKGDRDLAEICEAYANGLAKDSRFDTALEILNAWRADQPDLPIPLYRIGRIEEYLLQLDQAKCNYRAAIVKDKNFFPAVFGLARLCLKENDSNESLQLYKQCLRMPKPAAAMIGMAMSNIKLGDFESAKALLQEVVKLGSNVSRQSYASVGEPYERFIAASELGTLLSNEGKFEQALGFLEMALNENPRDISARYSKALALRGLKREREAEMEFESVSKTKDAFQKVSSLRDKIIRSSLDVDSRIELGKLLVQFESERTGLFWLRSALVHGEDNAKVHEALAEFYESHLTSEPSNERLAKFHRDRFRLLQKTQN